MSAKRMAREAHLIGLSGLPSTTEEHLAGGQREVEKERRVLRHFARDLIPNDRNSNGQSNLGMLPFGDFQATLQQSPRNLD
jgi:hypothetical protein